MAEDPPIEVLETEPVPPSDAAAQAQARAMDEMARRKGRVRMAWMIAIAADALQIAVFPLFLAGAASPAGDVLDVAVAIAMVVLLGWHVAFLPTLVAEVLPVVSLIPTWTAAVWFVTRTRKP